jgi:hypothetical protein
VWAVNEAAEESPFTGSKPGTYCPFSPKPESQATLSNQHGYQKISCKILQHISASPVSEMPTFEVNI